MNTKEILEERGKTHGDFSDNARVSQQLKMIVREEHGYRKLNPVQKEAIDMILHKISRALCGNPNEPDHWEDMAGYSTLVVNRLKNVIE